MNVTDVLRVMRNKLSDTGAAQSTWSDQEILDAVHTNVASMMQERVDANPTYHNAEAVLFEDDSRQLAPSLYEWVLGGLVYKMIHVRPATDPGDATAKPYTMALVDQWPVPSRHWQFSGTRRLVVGLSEVQDLIVQYAKTPARLFRYTVDLSSEVAADQLWFAQTMEFESDREPGAYINAYVEVTGVVTGSAADTTTGRSIIGQRRVVVGSSNVLHTQLSVYRPQLALSTPFTANLEVGHVVESHVEFEEAHMEYLLLSTQETLMQKKDNAVGIQTIGPRIARERGRWHDHIRRETPGPLYIAKEEDLAGGINVNAVDVDPDWELYG